VTAAVLDRDRAFLGVERSLTGRRWRERPADPDVTRGLQARLGLTEPIARALAARGVGVEDGEDYLRPTFRALFPDPSSFADMDLAARLIVDALETDRRMVVFADYDVDGATSAAQLVRWFRAMGKTLPVYVPDRLTEGYGPSPAAFRNMRSEGVELVITVDCGAAANDALNAAAEIGLDVVVVDHHLMRETPPVAAALVNPNRADCRSGQGMLAAAGVTFVLIAALNREARRRDLFRDRAEPDPRQWLDLAALGAICDVTQLTGFNRALTAQGLRAMSGWTNPGLAALMRVAGAKMGQAGVFEAGFILGPRINAGGRIGRADLGARLLATEDLAEADDLALQLHLLNAERKNVEAAIAEEARAAIERDSNFDPAAPAIVIANEGWHPGVIGIVASRLRETYRKPVVVVGIDRAADIGKGSGRSQPGVNLGRAVQAAFDEGLLLAGGGHAMAAGVTLRPSDIPEFRAFLCERLADEMRIATAEDSIDVDVLAAPSSARDLLSAFETLAPFGPGNPEPVYAVPDVRCENAMVVRGGHVRVSLRDSHGGRLKAIAWRAEGGPLGDRLLAGAGTLHLVGKLKRDDWNGADGAQMEIEDGADPRRV
jgi:single-stranded-DNA-specific exonuclease